MWNQYITEIYRLFTGYYTSGSETQYQVSVDNIFLNILYILRRKHSAYMKVNWRSLCQLRSTMFLPRRKVMCGAANFIIMLYDLLYVLRSRWMETFIFICWKTSYLRSWRKNKFTFLGKMKHILSTTACSWLTQVFSLWWWNFYVFRCLYNKSG